MRRLFAGDWWGVGGKLLRWRFKMKTENIGTNFDDFLQEEGLLDEANAVAIKRVIVWQIGKEMKAQKMNIIARNDDTEKEISF